MWITAYAFTSTLELVMASKQDVIRQCCVEVGLDPDRDAGRVADAIDEGMYEPCCESACDPCVLTIERAAWLAKRRLAT